MNADAAVRRLLLVGATLGVLAVPTDLEAVEFRAVELRAVELRAVELHPARPNHLRSHPADEGVAELEYVPSRGRLEVAVRVDALTLDRALSAYSGREVKLEDPKGEVALLGYLSEGFRIQTRPTAPGDRRFASCTNEWVGLEFDGPNVWLYFEVPVLGAPTELRGSFEMLFDLFTTQVNVLFATGASGEERHVFRFASGWADLSAILRPA